MQGRTWIFIVALLLVSAAGFANLYQASRDRAAVIDAIEKNSDRIGELVTKQNKTDRKANIAAIKAAKVEDKVEAVEKVIEEEVKPVIPTPSPKVKNKIKYKPNKVDKPSGIILWGVEP